MGVLAAVAGVLFWFTFRHLDEEEDALNELAEGRANVGMDAILANEVGSGLGGGKPPVALNKV